MEPFKYTRKQLTDIEEIERKDLRELGREKVQGCRIDCESLSQLVFWNNGLGVITPGDRRIVRRFLLLGVKFGVLVDVVNDLKKYGLEYIPYTGDPEPYFSRISE